MFPSSALMVHLVGRNYVIRASDLARLLREPASNVAANIGLVMAADPKTNPLVEHCFARLDNDYGITLIGLHIAQFDGAFDDIRERDCDLFVRSFLMAKRSLEEVLAERNPEYLKVAEAFVRDRHRNLIELCDELGVEFPNADLRARLSIH